MPNNRLLFSKEAKEKLLAGMSAVARAVSSTMGVGGKNVIFIDERGKIRSTKDGVTVAKYVRDLEDPVEEIGAQLIKHAANKTALEAGDGPQPLYSKVLTPNGFIQMGDIKVGDLICGTNGTVQYVEGVFPKGQKQIVQLVFEGNRVVECCHDHLWQITTTMTSNSYISSTKNIIDIVQTFTSDTNDFAVYVPLVSSEDGTLTNVKLEQIIVTQTFTDMQCIKVSNQDSLYITDNYIVTHNTTTSTVLAYEIVSSVFEEMKTQNLNAVEVKRGIDKAKDAVIEELKKMSQSISSKEDMRKVATLSANGDTEIGDFIVEALNYVGKEGIVSIEEGNFINTRLEKVEGLQFDKGYTSTSPYFINDNANSQCVFKDALVFVADGALNSLESIMPLLTYISSNGKPLLMIAESFGAEIMETLLMNKSRGALDVCCVKSPDFGEWKRGFYEDAATVTGGKVFSQSKGDYLDEDTNYEELLGRARRIVVKHNSTVLIDGKTDRKRLKKTVEALKKAIEKEGVEERKEKLNERLAKISGGVAVIHVGGFNEVERKEKKDRFDDALYATKSALEEGTVPGGGTTLLRISEKSDLFSDISANSTYQVFGVNVLKKAITKPFFKILDNAGTINATDVHKSVKESENIVFNPLTNEYVDAYESGIIDPTKVTRSALENAVAIAGTIILNEAVIYPITSSETDNK